MASTSSLNSVGSHEPLKPRIVPPPPKQKPKLKLGELRDEGESEHRELSGTDKAPAIVIIESYRLGGVSLPTVFPPSNASSVQLDMATADPLPPGSRALLRKMLLLYSPRARLPFFRSLSPLRRAFVMTDAPLRLFVQRLLPRLSRSCATTLSVNPYHLSRHNLREINSTEVLTADALRGARRRAPPAVELHNISSCCSCWWGAPRLHQFPCARADLQLRLAFGPLPLSRV